MITRNLLLVCSTLLVTALSSDVFAQQQLTKEEIRTEWKKQHPNRSGQDGYEEIVNEVVIGNRRQFLARIHDLQLQHIDTFAVLSIAFPGSFGRLDTCRPGIPADLYLFWTTKGKEFVEKVSARCSWYAREITPVSLFDYYAGHLQNIKNEEIMPVIFDASRDSGKIHWKISYIDHEPKYKLYVQSPGDSIIWRFDASNLYNKGNIFYDDNITSHLYHWFRLMQEQVDVEWRKIETISRPPDHKTSTSS